ncbi:MAG: ABC transporter permease, partial [Lachnospiraceae bacterium]|nr:ABC transporter permease [Lachnospiraceae bacterium]
MHKFIGLTRRNLLVYFKDRTSVFFSMLTPLIIFVLYLLFLRQTYVNSIENAAEALMYFIQSDDIAALSN